MVNFEKIKEELKNGYAKITVKCDEKLAFPEFQEVKGILNDFRKLFYPTFFARAELVDGVDGFIERLSGSLYFRLKKQIALSLSCNEKENDAQAEQITDGFFGKLPQIQKLLASDVQAAFDGDPAAKCKEEIILSYHGIFLFYS